MSDSDIEEIRRVRAELLQQHGGWKGYFAYIQKLDRAHRRAQRPNPKKKPPRTKKKRPD